ncbi:MAG: pseudouridine synthase [Verrucomicrobiae bacterium]
MIVPAEALPARPMRLNRFLAAAGLGSRRGCDELIASGAVAVNGSRVEKLATQVGPDDDVRVHGRVIRAARQAYLLLNKPRGYLVTRSDELGRRTIYDILPPEFSTLSHVGRLDKESEGLLLLTNDGDLAQSLTHPSHEIEKEYEVTLDKAFDPAHTPKLIKGIFIEGGRGRFERVHILAPDRVKVVLRQGLKRQIRLMLYSLGYEVERLKRTRIGSITDARIPSGSFRHLSPGEVEFLKRASRARAKPAKSRAPARKPMRKAPARRPRT